MKRHRSFATCLSSTALAAIHAAAITGCQADTNRISSTTKSQVLRGDYQTGETSIVSQTETGLNTFDLIEVIKEPLSGQPDLITVASGRFYPERGTTNFRFIKPYTCSATSKTAEISTDFFVDEFIISTCHWIPAGSRQTFKPLLGH